jgi:hypothetical protein
MVPYKSLDESKIIAALLHDVFTSCGTVFDSASRKNTLNKVLNRLASEGIGFLTKTLPRLGKAFDKALTGATHLNAIELRFEPQPNSQLPKLFGELFNRVFQPNGALLQDPCEKSVSVLRQILFVFYKYELPYTVEQEQQVVSRFEKTEDELTSVNCMLKELKRTLDDPTYTYNRRRFKPSSVGRQISDKPSKLDVAREARILLNNLFSFFDPKDIYPRHGPGAVATKQQLSEKYRWTNVSARITAKYPFDEYFCSSLGHWCDTIDKHKFIDDKSLPARVILVPKDSRGPRLISCEPVDFQWIQQGLGRAIVELVERHCSTRDNVFFTDQVPNRNGARIGSIEGRYATLDLNEASDRVSLDLVHLLFPPHIYEYLEACRSSSTVLPSGKEIELKKFAPMGSCLCFPIMALTIWSILTAAAPDAYTRERIYVYGDDVIVPTAYAVDAMEHLESFGLKINRDKSCISGLFRESCGMDAFKGKDVTPVRFRTVWSSSRSPDSYTSWIAYANSFYDKGYYNVYDCIVESLHHLYGGIPTKDMSLTCPSLVAASEHQRPIRSKASVRYQRVLYHVWDVKSVVVNHVLDGWSMLLRYFSEKANNLNQLEPITRVGVPSFEGDTPFSVRSYTRRRTSMLVRRWR